MPSCPSNKQTIACPISLRPREHAIEICLDVRLLPPIDHVADDLRQLLYPVVVLRLLVENAQQFASIIVQSYGPAILQLVVDRKHLSTEAAKICVESLDQGAVMAAQHGCQRFIEIGQFLFIDVYKLRQGRVQNQRTDMLGISLQHSHHQTSAIRDTHKIQRVDVEQAAKIFDICCAFVRVVGGEINSFLDQLFTALSDR